SIYIPYFTALNAVEILIASIVFFIMVGVLCYVSYRLASLDFVSEKVEKYERWIVPIVFIGLGIYIMFENGRLNVLFSFQVRQIGCVDPRSIHVPLLLKLSCYWVVQ